MTPNTQGGQDALKAEYIDREEARHVVHAAIFAQCMKDKNTCAGDYSYHALAAINAIPSLPAPTADRLALAREIADEAAKEHGGGIGGYAWSISYKAALAALTTEKPNG